MAQSFLNAVLFILTFFTTCLAGVQWLNKDPLELSNLPLGLPYSLSLLSLLAAHEFGHYFAARYHQVKTTLPFFIPVPPFLLNPFGTMGAVIRIRSPLTSKKMLFDIGIAGPLAGLVVTLFLLLYGFSTLPPQEYLYTIHPEYRTLANPPTTGLTFGNSLFFAALAMLFSQNQYVPPMNEIYHYPFICVGWFGLFVTALNLIPVGQLDGGHILYALIGRKQGIVARIFFITLIVIGITSFFPIFGQGVITWTLGWLVWAGILYFVIKLDHPEIQDAEELTPLRKFLGWFSFVFFIISFPPIPFYEILPPH
jgi:membrane-associated protease RseP (regulator of RpoE activity)